MIDEKKKKNHFVIFDENVSKTLKMIYVGVLSQKNGEIEFHQIPLISKQILFSAIVSYSIFLYTTLFSIEHILISKTHEKF